MSAEDGYCSTGTDSPRADSVDEQPAADADSPPGGGQSKRDHPSPSSPLPPPKRRYLSKVSISIDLRLLHTLQDLA